MKITVARRGRLHVCSIRALAADLTDRDEHIDVLVNNAAVLLDENERILALSPDDLRETFDTNVFAPIAVSRAFVPSMIARGCGRIVNVSSQAGQLTSMGTYAPAYSGDPRSA